MSDPVYLVLVQEKCLELALENAEQIWWLGKHHERLFIISLAKKRICFDHAKGCDHAACYALSDLIKVIQEERPNV